MENESKFSADGRRKGLQQDHHKVLAAQQEEKIQYLAGRGAQFNTKNLF